MSADVGTDEAAVDDSTPTPTFLDNDLKEGDYRRVKNLYRAQGRAACYVYDEWWRRCEVDFVVPGKERLFTFDVPGVGGAPFLLVLDPYGDEVMSKKIRREVLGVGGVEETVGVRRDTGEVVLVGLIEQRMDGVGGESGPECTIGVSFRSFPCERIFLPDDHRARLGELHNKKRPFYLTVRDHCLFDFIERWASYSDVLANLVVSFAFDGEDVQVSGDSWRSVTRWETTASRAPR